jgi:hypothetical protein
MPNTSRFGTEALRRLHPKVQPNTVAYFSEPAIFRQSFTAITKTVQEGRLVPLATLYRIGSGFAYGIDSKKERFGKRTAQIAGKPHFFPSASSCGCF